MNVLNKLKTKTSITYIVLVVGFIFSLIININFVSDRAVSSLTQLQKNHTELQAQSTFNNIQQFVENRVKLLAELARSSIVTSSVMGVDLASVNLTDLLNERKILGTKENIYLTDFTGELIYPRSSINFSRPLLLEKIIEQEYPLVLSIITKQEEHYFSISMPVKYNNHVEGLIAFDIINYSLEKLLAELTKNNTYAVSLANKDNLLFQTSPLNDFSLVSKHLIANTTIELNFYTSTSQLQEEKKQYVWQIGSTIATATLFTFILLAFLIRSFLINPLEKLAISEKKIKQSEERYQLAIHGSNDGIWDWNIKEDNLYLSPRLSSMVGYETVSEKKLINAYKLFISAIHPDDVKKAQSAFKEHFTNNIPLDFDFRMRILSGQYKHFRIRGIAQKEKNGKATRMAGSLSDVTELKDKSLALEKALSEAKSANIAKSDFLANMSHEIRTPMNGVLGALQILKQDNLSVMSNDLVDMGISSSKNLLSIINDILDLSKIESNNISLESLPINIVELFNSITNELSILANEKGITLALTTTENKHPYWLADPVRLRQIILNLISNAIKFTPKGKVHIVLSEHKDQLVFKVIDTGIGITQSQIKTLFNRFEQADTTTTRKFGGTGLGLPIAKQLINLMGGEITVTSEENVGSTFSVVLPLKKTDAKQHNESISTKAEIPNAETLHVLLAEDNRINQKVFQAILRPTQAKIIIANDGLEAISEVNKSLPDVIFMDIQMPNMDGIEACKAIKETHPNILIVALTANVMEQDIKKYKQTGFNYCLGKPIDVNEIYTLIQNIMVN